MYEAYLRQLLSPLGIYNLDGGSVNGAELYALGRALDRTGQRLETVERESVTATAEDEGLRRRRQPDPLCHQPRHSGLRHPGQGPGDGYGAPVGDLSGGGRHSGGV